MLALGLEARVLVNITACSFSARQSSMRSLRFTVKLTLRISTDVHPVDLDQGQNHFRSSTILRYGENRLQIVALCSIPICHVQCRGLQRRISRLLVDLDDWLTQAPFTWTTTGSIVDTTATWHANSWILSNEKKVLLCYPTIGNSTTFSTIFNKAPTIPRCRHRI